MLGEMPSSDKYGMMIARRSLWNSNNINSAQPCFLPLNWKGGEIGWFSDQLLPRAEEDIWETFLSQTTGGGAFIAGQEKWKYFFAYYQGSCSFIF